MSRWDINTDQYSNRGRNLRFYPPSKAQSKGWNNVITLCAENLYCFHEHVIPLTMPGLTFMDREGAIHARDRETRVTCLGSPRVPLGGAMPEPVYDQQGVAICGSIILPDGSALHSHGFIRGNEKYPPQHPWLVFIPIYNHTTNQFFVIQDYIEKVWIRSIIDEVRKHDDDPRTYSLMLQSAFAGQTRITVVSRVPKPEAQPVMGQTVPNPLQDETHKRDWERIQMICNPYRTPEALVQDLGIGQWNTRYAVGQAPPVQAAPPVNLAPPAQAPPTAWWAGADDDPFGDSAPAAGAVNKLPAAATNEVLPGSW